MQILTSPVSRVAASTSSSATVSITPSSPRWSRHCRIQLGWQMPSARASPKATSCLVPSRSWSTSSPRPTCATCSTWCRSARPYLLTRSSRRLTSFAASRPAQCHTARSAPSRTRILRSPWTWSARSRTVARVARTRTASAPIAAARL